MVMFKSNMDVGRNWYITYRLANAIGIMTWCILS